MSSTDTTRRREPSNRPPSSRGTARAGSARRWDEQAARYLEKPLPGVPAPTKESVRGRCARPRSPAPLPPLRITRKPVGSLPMRHESQSPAEPPQLPRKSSRRGLSTSMAQQRQQSRTYGEWRPSPDHGGILGVDLNPRASMHGKPSKKIAQLLGHDVDVNDGSIRGPWKPGHSRQTSDASTTSTVPSLARSVDSTPPLEPSRTGQSSRDTSWGSSPSRQRMHDQIPRIAFESVDGLPSQSPSADEIMLAGEYHQFAAELASLDRTSLDDNALHLAMPATKPTRPPRPADLEAPKTPARPATARESRTQWSPFPPVQQQQRPHAVPANPAMQSAFDSDSDDEEDDEADIKDRALKAIFGRKDGKLGDRLSVDKKTRAVADDNAGSKDAKGRWDSAFGRVRVWQALKEGKEK